MLAEKTVQEFLTAPVLLLRRLFGEGASGTAGAEGRLPSGRPRPPSTRCAAPDAHAPKMLILLSKQFAAAVFDLKKSRVSPAFRTKNIIFPVRRPSRGSSFRQRQRHRESGCRPAESPGRAAERLCRSAILRRRFQTQAELGESD